jgi:hypothetical protein
MKPDQIRYTIIATVTVETQDGTFLVRETPSFEVWATSFFEALMKARDIITASWHGPSKVSFVVSMMDEKGNYTTATEKGFDK